MKSINHKKFVMKVIYIIILNIIFSFSSSAADTFKEFQLPIGKSKCPNFSFRAPANWSLKLGRTKGDRWIVRDEKSKIELGYFAYNLPSTDQKMLPEVFEGSITLGSLTAEKYTVTLEFFDQNKIEEVKKAQTGLITSYRFNGKLKKLYFMSSSYDKISGHEKIFEKVFSSIKILSHKESK
jgi:hypothetical protein